jgi:hypothetical protein
METNKLFFDVNESGNRIDRRTTNALSIKTDYGSYILHIGRKLGSYVSCASIALSITYNIVFCYLTSST